MTDQAAALTADLEDGEALGSALSQEGQKPGGKKTILIVLAAVLVLVGLGVGVFFSGVLDGLLKGDGQTEKSESAPAKPAVFLDLPELLVNLNSSSRRTNFLKISISLEVANPDDVQKLQVLMPRIVDSFQVYLRELRIEDLRGSAGMYRLREDLLIRINEAARPVKVSDVLFKEILIQ